MSSVPELLLCLDTAIWQLGAKPFELMLPCLVINEADTAQCRQDVCSCNADKSIVVSLHRVQSASRAQLTLYELYSELSAIEAVEQPHCCAEDHPATKVKSPAACKQQVKCFAGQPSTHDLPSHSEVQLSRPASISTDSMPSQ